jgi:uncharacterized membrane protein YjfL (UPF0719 family)
MDWSSITDVAAHLSKGMPKFGAAVLVLIAGRWLFLLSTPFRADHDLLEDENPAAGVLFGAYLLGVAVAMAGTMFGRSQDSVLV